MSYVFGGTLALAAIDHEIQAERVETMYLPHSKHCVVCNDMVFNAFHTWLSRERAKQRVEIKAMWDEPMSFPHSSAVCKRELELQ